MQQLNWYQKARMVLKTLSTNLYDKIDLMMALAEYGDVVKTPFGNIYLINDPDMIKYVLHTRADIYGRMGSSIKKAAIGLGYGLLLNHGKPWADRREQLQPRFYFKEMKTYAPIITRITDRMLERWEKQANSWSKINVGEEMSATVLNITALCLFGKDIDEHCLRTVRELRHANDHLAMGKYFWMPTVNNLKFHRCLKKFNALSIDLLRGPHDNDFDHTPLLAPLYLPKDGSESKETREMMLGEAKNFLIAGHETTGCALTWAIYELGHNPECMQKLREEIDDAIGQREITYDDLPNLPYTRMVIDETLRKYPSIWIVERRLQQEDKLGEHKIPKNTLILISAYTTHRNKKYWENPEKFDPERFTPELIAKRPKNSYIPFGLGPRVCIGKHLALPIVQIVLAKVVQRYEFQLTTKRPTKKDPLITLKPSDDVMIRIKRRV